MVLGNLDIHMQKNEIGPLSNTFTKINPIWIKDLNIRAKVIKLLKENMGGKLHDIGFGNDFLHQSTSNRRKNK